MPRNFSNWLAAFDCYASLVQHGEFLYNGPRTQFQTEILEAIKANDVSRNFSDWLRAYVDYASFSEAPKRMHFWAGVSAIAGALRRRVWIDNVYFKWHANHYIIFVAPPGIVSKSTTARIAMDLLRKVPGVNFGPDIVTWPKLVEVFESHTEQFEHGREFITQCAVTLQSSELGNLINPQDREMIDLLVDLWDSNTGAFTKATKNSGQNMIENPWVNLIACTTPAWIAGNFPEYVIGGGFTSRCIFVYAEKKDKLIAYPHLDIPKDVSRTAELLTQDLQHIAIELVGKYELEPDALDWGRIWYKFHYDHPPAHLSDDRFGGYLARKQSHIHKLAMVIAAAQRDDLRITADDLSLASTTMETVEEDMPKVFAKIGRTQESLHAEKLINFICARPDGLPYAAAYQFIHSHFPDVKNFENILQGAIRAGFIVLTNGVLKPAKPPV